MSRYSSLDHRTNTHLPESYWAGHQLCFIVHDIMTQLLVSGRRASAFHVEFARRDEAEIATLEATDNIFDWLEKYRSFEERMLFL